MSGKSKKAAVKLGDALPGGDESANDPVLPCKKNKDPQLKVKVYGLVKGKKRYVQASVAANALSMESIAKVGIADFSYVLPGPYKIKAAQVSAPDDADFFVDPQGQDITLAKGDKKTVEIEVKPRNIVTPRIEFEYKVVLLPRAGLDAHQADRASEKLWTMVQVSYTETVPAYPFSQDVEFISSGVKVYSDEACTPESEVVGKFKLAPATIKKLYLIGTAAGEFDARFKLHDQADTRIRLADNPAEGKMAVIGVALEMFSAAKPHSKVLVEDTTAVTHTTMGADERLSPGRKLMLHDAAHHGRAKLVVKKPDDALWTIGEPGYKLRLGLKAVSGSLSLHDAEKAGKVKALSGGAIEFARADFAAGDITLWVEGAGATTALCDAKLHLGINRAKAGLYQSPKGYGDAARFTVVAVSAVKPDAKRKQYINLLVDVAKPEQGRKIKGDATYGQAIAGLDTLFVLMPDKDNKKNLKAGLEHQAGKDGDAAVPTTAGGVAALADMELSFYGGDKFELVAYLKDAPPPGKTVPAAMKSKELTVWRRLEYNAVYTMSGETYIDAATVPAEIEPAFKPAFIEYTRGAVQTVAANLSCKYLGLYDAGSPGNQKNWPAAFSPAALGFDPSAAELADYAGADVAKKALAKTAIETKAQGWFNAICNDYSACSSAWFNAVGGLGGNALLAVQYYHPKLSGIAADGVTNFWPAGISINGANPGSGLNSAIDPDQLWRNVQGFNRGTISVVFKNYGTAARLQIVCRHEIGHATKAAFGRDDFGVGDHSAAGLMTPYGGSNEFSATDINLLRGWKA
jgi:hypothetical protein